MNLENPESSHEEWLIDEFVGVANQLLPNYLPEIKGNTKVKEEINPRLVRHYTSLKLIDEPTRKNRYAFYNYRHLLQLLLVRRLLSDGVGAAAINDLLTTKTNEELKSLLIGGITINITTAHQYPTATNSALEYLANLKHKKQENSRDNYQDIQQNQANFILKKESFPSLQNKEIQNQSSFSNLEQWTHLRILNGLELHIRDDFVYPNSIKEQESLNQHLINIFAQWLTRKK